ncbi:cupredoxin domain-containing protein [Colwellia sp. 75C3]|nr:cupredoxin domain-containing protein [Colwellia sp. 75C3]
MNVSSTLTRPKSLFKVQFIISYILLMASYNVFAQRQEFSITLKDHLFYPAEMTIPANKKIKLIIDNQDDSVEEFDSFSLNREKVLFPKQKATIYIGPLSPGRYDFFGEYHPDSARGVIIVSEADLPIPAIKEVDNAN